MNARCLFPFLHPRVVVALDVRFLGFLQDAQGAECPTEAALLTTLGDDVYLTLGNFRLWP